MFDVIYLYLQILLFMGSFAVTPFFLKDSFTGAPLGELVQWSDLIATLYLLGHDIQITAEGKDIER